MFNLSPLQVVKTSLLWSARNKVSAWSNGRPFGFEFNPHNVALPLIEVTGVAATYAPKMDERWHIYFIVDNVVHVVFRNVIAAWSDLTVNEKLTFFHSHIDCGYGVRTTPEPTLYPLTATQVRDVLNAIHVRDVLNQ